MSVEDLLVLAFTPTPDGLMDHSWSTVGALATAPGTDQARRDASPAQCG